MDVSAHYGYDVLTVFKTRNNNSLATSITSFILTLSDSSMYLEGCIINVK